jgi:bis(5'-nucleosyl)-tetraphosphatase (symmetrical)
MPVYAIGDVQGCYDPLMRLLDKLAFDPKADRLWLTGDLVNRGPQSLRTLRFVKSLGDSAITVLGNHDLHLLAMAQNAGSAGRDRRDSLLHVIYADDGPKLLKWLRRRPLVHYDERLDMLLVHAGIPPVWSVPEAIERAREVEAVLHRKKDARALLDNLYGNKPTRWRDKLQGIPRLRYIINAFTRMRMLDAEGRLRFDAKGPPGDSPDALRPWYEVPGKRGRTRIVFGHWSALGLLKKKRVISLDTGCVWGRRLTAVQLDASGLPDISVSCSKLRTRSE